MFDFDFVKSFLKTFELIRVFTKGKKLKFIFSAEIKRFGLTITVTCGFDFVSSLFD